MGEWLVATATEAKVDRSGLVAVDSANEHDPIKCIAPDLAAFRRAEHHTELAFRVKIEQLPSCSPLPNHPAKFDEIGTKSLEWFSFRLQSTNHLGYALALDYCRAMHSNQMEHSIALDSTKTTPSMIPADKK